LANNFLEALFPIISMDLKSAQRKILRICDIQMQKKKLKIGVIEKILVLFGTSRMKIFKKWLNQLKNFFNKHYYYYLLAGEFHQFAKITVTYCTLHCI
jgi:hypothetical protein